MPIPTAGYPQTAAVSPRVQVVPATDSTNADVVAAVIADADAWPHLALLLTTDQRAGRGRLDRTWIAAPGTALAVSIVVRVPALPVAARAWIPLIAGAALTRAVAAQAKGHDVAMKWPNDVLVDGGKISGILAEAVPDHPDAVVVGAGVNTRMPAADLPVGTATSFEALGLSCDDDRLLAEYVSGLADALDSLAAFGGDAEAAGVARSVAAVCGTLGREVKVSLPDGSVMTGLARELDEDGRLAVVPAGAAAAVTVSAGDVVHVR